MRLYFLRLYLCNNLTRKKIFRVKILHYHILKQLFDFEVKKRSILLYKLYPKYGNVLKNIFFILL